MLDREKFRWKPRCGDPRISTDSNAELFLLGRAPPGVFSTFHGRVMPAVPKRDSSESVFAAGIIGVRFSRAF